MRNNPTVSLNARRGGFVHGTKISTDRGWQTVENLQAGDLIRTLDNGFKAVSRVSTDCIAIPASETKPENLPVRVPSNTLYNGAPVWLMPEQGVALDNTKFNSGPITLPISMPVVPARVLSGTFRLSSSAPSLLFEVCSLFFEQDEVIYIEGGLRAFCPAGRFGSNSRPANASYKVVDAERTEDLIDMVAHCRDIAVLANSLGAVPAPIMEHPIFPVRPVKGARRPGRPGRPAPIF
ncbi:Hint domain-containing protein [Ruegeria atlantica]|uniref:Hint domain-containing protein n=1 Tax=Ruegeria atlantica TaxID=81569 RepID=UPI00147D6996|nr:Hint domain-containing protein [Ruegeria atlantica]